MSLVQLLAWGVFASVPVLGSWLWPSRAGGEPLHSVLARRCAAGAAAWSIVLLFAIEGECFKPALFGAAGWLIVAAGATKALLRSRHPRKMPRPGRAEIAIFATLAAVALLNGWFSSQHILGGRDMGIYANTAVAAVRTGSAVIHYPIHAEDRESLFAPFFVDDDGDGLPPFPGLDPQPSHMVPQFSHLYPAWLGQAYAAGGHRAMFGFNAIFGLLSALALVTLASRFVPFPVAAAGALLLSLNPGQIWLSRITMSEIMAQYFLLVALDGLAEYAENSRTISGIWAGLLIAVAALVRIDSLLAIPLVLAGFGALRFMGWSAEKSTQPPRWGTFALSVLPAGGLAVAYYWVYCRAYMLDTLPLTIIVAVATAISLALFVPLPPRWKTALSRWLSSPSTLWILAAVLGALFAYGLLLRPHLEPFATWHLPGHPFDGLRDHREDSLVNLLAYMTPIVPPLALLGALVLFRKLQNGKTGPGAAPVLAALSGITIAFLYRPAIDARHLWAFRRFIPLAVPGLLVLAAIGSLAAWERLGSRVRAGMAIAFATCLFAIAGWVGAPFLAHPEYQGVYSQMASLASDAKGTRYLFARSPGGWGLWETPLLMTFGLPVLPTDLTEPGQARLFTEFVARERSEGKMARVAWEGGLPPEGLDLIPVADHTLMYSQHVPTLTPPPCQWETIKTRVLLFDVSGVSMIDRVVGGAPLLALPGANESVLWLAGERRWGAPGRWTNGRAVLTIPCPEDRDIQRLQLYLCSSKPGSCHLAVSVQGKLLAQRELPPGLWFGDLPLDGIAPNDGKLSVELASDAWVPAQLDSSSADTRTLGVRLDGLRLATRPFGPIGKPLPVSADRSRLYRMNDAVPLVSSEQKPLELELWAENKSDLPWPSSREAGPDRGPVRIGAKWYAGEARGPCLAENRGDLPFGLYPGESAPVSILLRPTKLDGAPLPAGRYRVIVGLLQEGVNWFSGSGDKSLEFDVEVRP